MIKPALRKTNALSPPPHLVPPHRAALLAQPQPGLSLEQRLDWSVGRSFAQQAWVSGPATTTARDGLGPLFNANSCSACHRDNGQGQLPPQGPGLIAKLRGPGQHPDDNRDLGEQLQDRALPGWQSEGRLRWQQQEVIHQGQTLTYRHYQLSGATKPLSPRLAPALIGQGLLDAVAEEQLLALADPDDRNGDGLSGRVNQVWDAEAQRYRPGRFGWKASRASLREQIALAFSQDLGIRSSLFPGHLCPAGKENCESEEDVEISDKLLDAVVFYIANLAVPAPPARDLPGAALFNDIGCSGCHRPQLRAKWAAKPVRIQPYSDLLLHDMGPALADPIGEFSAQGQEWRTAPLWGLGLRSSDPTTTRLLHDGRARSIHQAIAWHGGEAEQARRAYMKLNRQQQQQLLQFLEAL